MKLEYVPLLQVQRDLYKMPRGFERFREFIKTMRGSAEDGFELPLSAMNPMGKDHLPVFLDGLLGFDADGVAARATADAQSALRPLHPAPGTAPGTPHHAPSAQSAAFKVCIVVSDDLKGGWTNRYTSELGYRFEQKAMYRRGWVPAILWTADTYTAALVREEVLACIYRAAWVQIHGYARTLGEMLAQDGWAATRAGAAAPVLDDEDLAYTRDVIAPLRERTDRATIIAALFGDPAARELGYPPLGLSPRAGLALARDEARARV